MSIAAVSAVLPARVEEPSHWRILITLADYADADGAGAFPSIGTLAEITSLDRRTVQRALAALEAAGLVDKGDQQLVDHYPGNRRPTVWNLNLPAIRATRQGRHDDTPDRGGVGAAQGRAGAARNRVQGRHENGFWGGPQTAQTKNQTVREPLEGATRENRGVTASPEVAARGAAMAREAMRAARTDPPPPAPRHGWAPLCTTGDCRAPARGWVGTHGRVPAHTCRQCAEHCLIANHVANHVEQGNP